MIIHTCHTVDVFSSDPFHGNPVMVVVGHGYPTVNTMKSFAAWNGMPETAYIDISQREGCDYGVRIFSPRTELGFAGHPILAAAHVMAMSLANNDTHASNPSQNINSTIALQQRCVAGDVSVRITRTGPNTAFSQVKTPYTGTVRDLSAELGIVVADALGLPSPVEVLQVDAGAHWLIVELPSLEQLQALCINMDEIERISRHTATSGITVYSPSDNYIESRFEVRSFGPLIGVHEDAACGGGNACVGVARVFREGSSRELSYANTQGRFVGRNCSVALHGPMEDHRFWIGGSTRTLITGQVAL